MSTKNDKFVFYNDSRNIKAQAAIEYLMTYGWMLLAVGILGSTAYTTLGAECVPSVSGFEGQAVGVEDFALSTDGEFMLMLANSNRNDVEVQQVRAMQRSGDGEAINTTSVEIESGDQNPVTVTDSTESSEDCNTYDIEVTSDIGPLEVESSGSLTAPISPETPPPSPSGVDATH